MDIMTLFVGAVVSGAHCFASSFFFFFFFFGPPVVSPSLPYSVPPPSGFFRCSGSFSASHSFLGQPSSPLPETSWHSAPPAEEQPFYLQTPTRGRYPFISFLPSGSAQHFFLRTRGHLTLGFYSPTNQKPSDRPSPPLRFFAL